MLDNLPVPESTKDSLTRDEQTDIIAGTRTMPGTWIVDFDESPNGELYARLVPPWSDGLMSAFLLERQDGVIVLTDRLSYGIIQDIVSSYTSVTDAMSVVLTTVLGSAGASDT